MSRSNKIKELFVYPDPNVTHWRRWWKLYVFPAAAIAYGLLAWYLIDVL